MKYRWSGFLFLMFLCLFTQVKAQIVTADITRFWEAYDRLATAKTHADSLTIIQTVYLDQASEGFRNFQKIRNLSAGNYLKHLKYAPEFWKSIRANTMRIQDTQGQIDSLLDAFETRYKGFRRPRVCFAIGCLSTGGTVYDDWLLIGSEIVAADSTVDKSELGRWLNSVMTRHWQVPEYIVHETVHTLQPNGLWLGIAFKRNPLLTMSLQEGAADFVACKISGIQMNRQLHVYGNLHEKELWQKFSADMEGDTYDNWLYNGENSKDMPADMGYYVGYKICEAYYNKQSNKERALRSVVRMKNPRKFLRKSGYKG